MKPRKLFVMSGRRDRELAATNMDDSTLTTTPMAKPKISTSKTTTEDKHFAKLPMQTNLTFYQQPLPNAAEPRYERALAAKDAQLAEQKTQLDSLQATKANLRENLARQAKQLEDAQKGWQLWKQLGELQQEQIKRLHEEDARYAADHHHQQAMIERLHAEVVLTRERFQVSEAMRGEQVTRINRHRAQIKTHERTIVKHRMEIEDLHEEIDQLHEIFDIEEQVQKKKIKELRADIQAQQLKINSAAKDAGAVAIAMLQVKYYRKALAECRAELKIKDAEMYMQAERADSAEDRLRRAQSNSRKHRLQIQHLQAKIKAVADASEADKPARLTEARSLPRNPQITSSQQPGGSAAAGKKRPADHDSDATQRRKRYQTQPRAAGDGNIDDKGA